MTFKDTIKYVEIQDDGRTKFIGGNIIVKDLRKSLEDEE